MSFRYLLYVSDNKVDALQSQIGPRAGRWRTTKLRIGLTFLEMERSWDAASEGRFARLDRVLRYLQEYGNLGDVDAPEQFFAGTLPLRWGPYPTPDASLLYFTGRSNRTIVGLGGSVRHALDGRTLPTEDNGGGMSLSASALPSLLDALGSGRRDAEKRAERAIAGAEEEALDLVRQAYETVRYPAQNIEFVAKRLLQGPSPDQDDHPGTTVLLGSPLYAAVVD